MQGGSSTLTPEGSAGMAQSINMIKTLELLQKAIAYGHVDKAKELVAYLAKQKANVTVTELPDKPTSAFNEDIGVKVYVEDKDLSGSHIFMKLKPSMTIGQLKQKMQVNHGFPPEIQKWIVARRLVKDEESLQRLRVKNNSAMFLYLLSPKSVGLSQEEYTRKYKHNFQQNPTAQGDYIPMGQVTRKSSSGESSGGGPTPSPHGPRNYSLITGQHNTTAPGQVMPLVAEAEEENPYQTMYPLSMPEGMPPPPPTQAQQPREMPRNLTAAEVGWMCPTCTYMNEPTRPGCEMCATDRPEDYQMPEQEYQLTEREKLRLEQEKKAETLAKQSDPSERAEALDTHYTQRDFGFDGTVVGEDQPDTQVNRMQDAGEQLRLAEIDKSLALALQKEEEVDFERRHRNLQKQKVNPNTGGLATNNEEIQNGGAALNLVQNAAFPTQETGWLVEESIESNPDSFA